MSRLPSTAFVALALLPIGAALGCGAATPDASYPAEETGEVGSEAADPALAREVAAALDEALASEDAAARDDLRIFSECFLGDALYQVEVYGDGVGIWNGERQFRLSDARVTDILKRLRSARFGAFRETYGESVPKRPIPQDADGRGAPATGSATRVICLVALRIGEVEKQSIQISKPPRSEALQELAEGIFAIAREAGAAGVAAASLDDGLARVASGDLAPQTLSVLLQRKPEPKDAAAGAGGFLLRIGDGRATARTLEGTAGYGPPRQVDLSDEQIRALAGRLSEARLGEAPPNLWAEHYTDLTVRVLGHERQIQARRFARMTPGTHGEAQVRYDAAYRTLASLAEAP